MTLLLGSVTLIMTQDTPLWQFFLSRLDVFDSIFSWIVWNDKLHYLMKEFVSLKIVAMDIVAMGKTVHQKHEPYRCKLSPKIFS